MRGPARHTLPGLRVWVFPDAIILGSSDTARWGEFGAEASNELQTKFFKWETTRLYMGSFDRDSCKRNEHVLSAPN